MFKIKKHYFDGIDESGNAIILYSAKLEIFGIKIPYSSCIFSSSNKIFEKSTLKKSLVENQKIENKKLNFSGTWQNLEKPVSEILIDEDSKYLKWNCHTPKAKFKLNLNDELFEGLGYAETLEMNFAPWKLPISELKWGRFLSENNCVIWIEWIGEKPLKKIFWNGKPIENAEISDSGIVFKNENATLIFENPISIKDEKLLAIAEKYKFLKLFFNKKFLESREIKFKSSSILKFEDQEETGFSLYEKVLWKK